MVTFPVFSLTPFFSLILPFSLSAFFVQTQAFTGYGHLSINSSLLRLLFQHSNCNSSLLRLLFQHSNCNSSLLRLLFQHSNCNSSLLRLLFQHSNCNSSLLRLLFQHSNCNSSLLRLQVNLFNKEFLNSTSLSLVHPGLPASVISSCMTLSWSSPLGRDTFTRQYTFMSKPSLA